jgi:hypothetical protein
MQRFDWSKVRKLNTQNWAAIALQRAFPTLWITITAANWVGGFMAMSALAQAIYNYFDIWFEHIAQFVLPIITLVVPNFTTLDVKEFVILIGVLAFAFAGFSSKSLLQTRKSTTIELCLALIGATALGIVIVLKLFAIHNGDTVIDQFWISYYNPLLYFSFVIGSIISLLILVLLRAFIKQTVWPFYIAAIIQFLLVVLLRFHFDHVLGEEFIGTSLVQNDAVSLADIAYASLLVLPMFLLTLNPKRVRQIAAISLLFVGLAISSIPLSRAFPALMPKYETGSSDVRREVASGNGSRGVLGQFLDRALSQIYSEKVVILLEGKNIQGDQIYTYLELKLINILKLRATMKAQKEFNPGDYGTVLAAGKGSPSPELEEEMRTKYNMIEVPKWRPVHAAQSNLDTFVEP